tara:strand:- start:1222 stop:2385 length:1164 start_codon:yes stop_codon:yes gene_type:complete
MLNGIRVVELATYVAAPAAGALLADYGADVIKVEGVAGDPMRQFFASVGRDSDGENKVFGTDNRGKRSVVIDISSPEGREEMLTLIETADVFLTNARPASLTRAGLDWSSLKTIKPDLIYASFTGYGEAGEEADKPGFDIAAFWARTGLCWLTTVKGGPPAQLRTGIGDHTASLAMLSGILGALYHRERTGEGQKVASSLVRTGVYAAASEHAVQMQLGKIGSTKSRHEAVNPVNNFFQTSDGRWIVIVPRQGPGDWPALAAAAGRSQLVVDPRFASIRDRRANAAALVDELDTAFGAMTFDQVAAALDRENMIWGPVLTVGQAVRDPQLRAAGCYVNVEGEEPGAGGGELVSGPIDFECLPRRNLSPAPSVGEHTAEIRAEMLGKA